MNVLAFDTAMGALSAAIWSDGHIISARHAILSRGHAEKLMPMVADVCDEAGLEVASCDRIGVTIGPGTFTGQRVGLAAARAMKLGTSLDLVGVTTLQALAAAVEDAATDDAIVSVIDARRGELYVQAFSPTLEDLSPPAVLSPPDAVIRIHKLDRPLIIVGTGAGLMAPVLADKGAQFRYSTASAQPDARLVARLAAAADMSVPQVPSPLYLRAPDAKLPQSK